jgi:hypothetical protein
MEHHARFRNWAPGIFTGFEQWQENTLPLGLNLKYFLPAGRCEFFLAGMGGYSFSLHEPSEWGMQKASGGITAGSEAGVLIHINSLAAITFGVGYRHQKLNYELEDWFFGTYDRKVTYNRVSLRMGISFH